MEYSYEKGRNEEETVKRYESKRGKLDSVEQTHQKQSVRKGGDTFLFVHRGLHKVHIGSNFYF